MGPKLPKNDLAALIALAETKGLQAGHAAEPIPMHIVQRANPLDDTSPVVKRYEPVMDGVCGFAWIRIRPGNSPLANFLKKVGKAEPAYEGGVDVWVSGFNQSMTRKEAYAHAYAKVLNDAGFDRVYAQSRMD